MLIRLFFIVIGVFGLASLCHAQMAEAVWFGSDEEGLNHIYYASLEETQEGSLWSQSDEPIYSSNNYVLTPVIATAKDASKVLVWSESRGSAGSVLMIMRGYVQQEVIKWSNPTVFADQRAYNVGPIAIRDVGGRMWVLWAADDGTDSDIFYVYSDGSGWSEPQMAHEDNDDPELSPEAEIHPNGSLLLRWLSFDPVAQEYVAESKEIQPSSSSKQQVDLFVKQNADVEEISMEQIDPPFFFPEHQLIRLHYPANNMHQHENVTK